MEKRVSKPTSIEIVSRIGWGWAMWNVCGTLKRRKQINKYISA